MDTYSRILIAAMAAFLTLFFCLALSRFLKKRRVLKEVADYYRGYNEMMEVCTNHGVDSAESRYWLFQSEVTPDPTDFDRGVKDAYRHCAAHQNHWKKI